MDTRPDRRATYEDYVRFPEGERYELIDGEAWGMPSPNTRHQEVLGRLLLHVFSFLEDHGGGRVLFSRFEVVLSPHDVLQPDLIFIAQADLDVRTASPSTDVPYAAGFLGAADSSATRPT